MSQIIQNNETGDQPIVISYLTLRKIVGLLGIGLPIILVLGLWVGGQYKAFQESISAYYYTNMRDVFVGTLCAVGLFLFSYNGYEKTDRIASFVSGAAALGVAFFPMKGTVSHTLHFIFAGIFFLTLSYYSIFLFTKTSGDMTAQKRERNVIYKICGGIMILCVVSIGIYNALQKYNSGPEISSFIFIMETIALFAFGLSWMTKGEVFLKDK